MAKNILARLAMALVALLVSASVPAFAAVPDWVKQAGMYVEIDDVVDKGYGVDPEVTHIKGYLVNYDVECTTVGRDILSWEGYDGKRHFKSMDCCFNYRGLNGVGSLIYQEDGKVYMRGFAMYKEANLKNSYSQGYTDMRYWTAGEYNPSTKEISIPNPTVLEAEEHLSGHTSSSNSATLAALYYGEDGEIYVDKTSEKIVFRVGPSGELEYVAPEYEQGAQPGYGIQYYYSSSHDPQYRRSEYWVILLDRKITLRDAPFFPKNLDWQTVTASPQPEHAIHLAKDGNTLYLNFCNQLIKGEISNGKVTFKGGQASSISLPNPKTGVVIPEPLSEELYCLKGMKSWSSEEKYETTDEDVVFDYDYSARKLTSRKGFLFMSPQQLPSIRKRGIGLAPYKFETLVIKDVPPLY